MSRKLNYIFSQVLDNYKAAYKGNRPFYIGFGLLFVFINAIVYIGINALGFLAFGQNPEYNTTYLMYSYLLLLTIPCLATLKNEDETLKVGEVLSQNMAMIMAISVVATLFFFFIRSFYNSFHNDLWYSFGGLVGILGGLLVTFIILSILRLALKKPIPFFDRLVETLIVTIFLTSIIQEFQSFFYYGLVESFRFIFSTDLGEIVFTPVLFILVNLLLSPILVCIITTTIRYETTPKVSIEKTSNEEL